MNLISSLDYIEGSIMLEFKPKGYFTLQKYRNVRAVPAVYKPTDGKWINKYRNITIENFSIVTLLIW